MPISTDKKWLKGRNKQVTGFCNDFNKPGQHEGTKPKNWRGQPMKTCQFWTTCPCECHKSVDLLFEMTGMERREVPNPEYIPQKTDFRPPLVEVDPIGDVALDVVPVIAPGDLERTVTVDNTPAATPLAQRRTPTGRAARGGLEAQVWDACTNMVEQNITPRLVCEWIAEKYKIPLPSSGAVNAVWGRWENLNFAKMTKKPNRFVGFEGEGTWEELERLKGSVKRKRKSETSMAMRGYRNK